MTKLISRSEIERMGKLVDTYRRDLQRRMAQLEENVNIRPPYAICPVCFQSVEFFKTRDFTDWRIFCYTHDVQIVTPGSSADVLGRLP